MAWEKVSDIRWERPHSDLTPALEDAWKRICYEQPQIASTVDGMKKVYEIPDTKALEEWLESTFAVSTASDAEELYVSVKPIKQATLYYIPKSSELVFRGHNHMIDGTGVLLFWHSYLEALSSPNANIEFGNESARLAPTMEQALGYPEQTTQEMSEKAKALFAGLTSGGPGIGLVSQSGVAPSGNCQNAELVLPVATTDALVAACKSKGVTVTAAVHAAYIGAIVKHVDPNSNASQYVTANQFNLRSFLPEPYSSSKYAASVYYTPFPYRADLPASYWDLAKSLHKYYQTSFKGNPKALGLNEPLTRDLCRDVQTPEFLDEFLERPVPKDALVSSLGVAERYDLTIGVDVVIGMSMFFFTFRDQLRLMYSFNDGFEKREDIQQYLEEVKSILIRELLA
ncbi:hypothetical protein F5Y10DRAFT_283518 [Nemania abortiva]|nr:hypothetical protein F5Y10DRAFT_283518 [Nemania abortiva]